MTKSYIENHDAWRGELTWHKMHSSELFVMQVSVHSESSTQDRPIGSPPRYWCAYLLGSDMRSWTSSGKMEARVEKSKLTDLVYERGQSLFESLDWNGGITFFKTTRDDYELHKDVRTWKVGDDHTHLWDVGRWDNYDFNYISSHIQTVADQFYEKIKQYL